MSDIGLYGLAAALAGVAMLAIAAVGLLIETALWRRRRKQGEATPVEFAFLAPAAYAALAIAVLVAADLGPLTLKSTLDDVAPIVAGAGLVLWLGIRLTRRRSPPASGDAQR